MWEHFKKELIIDPKNPNGPKISITRCNYYKDFFSITGRGIDHLLQHAKKCGREVRQTQLSQSSSTGTLNTLFYDYAQNRVGLDILISTMGLLSMVE